MRVTRAVFVAATRSTAGLAGSYAGGVVFLGGQAGRLLAGNEATDGLPGDVVRPDVSCILTAIVFQLK